MIGKQIKGRGFRGLLNYLEKKEQAELIGGNMGGRDAEELAKEFRLSRQLNPKLERAVYHASLSLPQHERLEDQTWSEIAGKYLEGMGFDCNQYAVYRHHDQDHDHIHIIASRINMETGKTVHDGWDYPRSEKVIRQLERDYGLEQTVSSRDKLERTASTGQRRRVERQQQAFDEGSSQVLPELPIKEQLQSLLRQTASPGLSMSSFIDQLPYLGIEARAGFTRTGKNKGISYEYQGQHFSGTQLGAAYTFPGLQKHLGISYEPNRDDDQIRALMAVREQSESVTTPPPAPLDNPPQLTKWEVQQERTQIAAPIVDSWLGVSERVTGFGLAAERDENGLITLRRDSTKLPIMRAYRATSNTSDEWTAVPTFGFLKDEDGEPVQEIADFVAQRIEREHQRQVELEQVQQVEREQQRLALEQAQQAERERQQRAQLEPIEQAKPDMERGSVQWDKAVHVLNYVGERMQAGEELLESSRYRAEWDSASRILTVTAKADDRVVARGFAASDDWEILNSNVSAVDWAIFSSRGRPDAGEKEGREGKEGRGIER